MTRGRLGPGTNFSMGSVNQVLNQPNGLPIRVELIWATFLLFICTFSNTRGWKYCYVFHDFFSILYFIYVLVVRNGIVKQEKPEFRGYRVNAKAYCHQFGFLLKIYTVVFHRLSAFGKFSKTPQIVRSGKFLWNISSFSTKNRNHCF